MEPGVGSISSSVRKEEVERESLVEVTVKNVSKSAF
jgi:hypothetical protein